MIASSSAAASFGATTSPSCAWVSLWALHSPSGRWQIPHLALCPIQAWLGFPLLALNNMQASPDLPCVNSNSDGDSWSLTSRFAGIVHRHCGSRLLHVH